MPIPMRIQRFIEQLPYEPGNQAKQDLWQALSITSKMSSKEDYQERVKRLHDWEEHVKKKFTREIRDRFLLKSVLVRLMVDTIDSPAKSHRMPTIMLTTTLFA